MSRASFILVSLSLFLSFFNPHFSAFNHRQLFCRRHIILLEASLAHKKNVHRKHPVHIIASNGPTKTIDAEDPLFVLLNALEIFSLHF